MLSEKRIWKFFVQILLGLDALHSKWIIHRDLKSLNIFLTKRDSLKIGDLGVAITIDEEQKVNKWVGTPYYQAPEIWENKPYDEKSDIWSLGVILYEIITLSKPFQGLDETDLGQKILKGKFKWIP